MDKETPCIVDLESKDYEPPKREKVAKKTWAKLTNICWITFLALFIVTLITAITLGIVYDPKTTGGILFLIMFCLPLCQLCYPHSQR